MSAAPDGAGRRVILVTPSLAPFDAIGNDVIGMRECLARAGFAVELYAGEVHPRLSSVGRKLDLDSQTFWEDREALLVYHHSMGWPEGQDLLESARGRIVVKYHNITPPRFFQPYSDVYTAACRAGECANFRVANHRRAIFWGDSTFNCDDLQRYGAKLSRCRVLAPFHCAEDAVDTPHDRAVLQRYGARSGTKLLFVGGIKPNKGHIQLLRVTAEYKRAYDPDVTLFLPGAIDPRLKAYQRHLEDVIGAHGLHDNVVFPGSVSAAALRSYFLLCDVFLCLSEHEGFCVPLIEAMVHRMPIVAASRTAVGETVDGAGLLWEEDAAGYYVEGIAACMESASTRQTLQTAGFRRFETHFRREVLGGRLLELVEEAFAQPAAN
jgi:glycosyltransferase involved in cell wall biosynthesis